MNDIKDNLQETLQRHADDLYGAPLSLDTVRTRARRIQRNRRLAVAGGIAAALVVIIPTGMLAAGNLGGGNDSGPQVTTGGPSPTKAEDPQLEASGVGIPYAQGATVTMPDGTEVHLPHAYQQVVVAGGEVYGADPDPDTGYWTVDVIGAAGINQSFETVSGVTPDSHGTVVVWSTPEGNLTSRASGQVSVLVAGIGEIAPVAVTGGPDCDAEADGCTVYYTDEQGRQMVIHSGDGAREMAEALKVDDATPGGLVAMQTKSTIDGSCSKVLDQSSGKTPFTTCDYTLGRFSPDGRYLSGGPSYLDSIGSAFAVILDAQTGKEVARYAPEGGTVFSTTWEDDNHLLVLQHDGSGWSVKRLTAGSNEIEDVLGPDDSTDEVTPAYVLANTQ